MFIDFFRVRPGLFYLVTSQKELYEKEQPLFATCLGTLVEKRPSRAYLSLLGGAPISLLAGNEPVHW